MDVRSIRFGGTGVSTYARALNEAQRALSIESFTLDDDSALPGTIAARAGRWLRALGIAPVGLALRSPRHFSAADIFRLAQVHFDARDRLLTLQAPVSGGIMHWSYPLPIRIAGWRNVYTIHDAIPLATPALSPIGGKRHRRLLARIGESAEAIVTVSGSARAEIANAMGWLPERMVNCSVAVTAESSADEALPLRLERGAFLVTLGSVEPRKNLGRLLAAHAASDIALPLVVVGPATRQGAELEQVIAQTPNVVRLPYVSRGEAAALIAGARALLMPSLAEGFGLPVMEAMSLGTPVIASCRGALAETAGNAALLVDPEDIAEMVAAIRVIAHDNGVCARLVRAGLARAAQFTAPLFAARLGTLYTRLIALPAERI